MPSDRRLHPFSILFGLGRELRQFVIPGIVVFVTAGTAGGDWQAWTLLFLIPYGAAVVLLMSAARAEQLGLRPLARCVSYAVAGSDPRLMLTGCAPATRKALDRAGLSIDDVDLFEINEAFAPVVLAWERELGVDLGRVNVNGGAIALGHPLGASGARLVLTLARELEARQAVRGLATMCIGVGQGIAVVLERA